MLDGTPATLMAALPDDISSVNVYFDDWAEAGERFYVTGYREQGQETLYAADAAGAMTPLLTSVTTGGRRDGGVTSLTELNGRLYFFANGQQGDALYSTDGTAAGTRLVKLLRPNRSGSLPYLRFVHNERLYFFWETLSAEPELWSTDGTEAGTVRHWAGTYEARPLTISPLIDGHVFFGVLGGFWRTDLTAEGTVPVWTGQLDQFSAADAFTTAGDNLFFRSARFVGSDRSRLYVAGRDGSGVRQVNVPWGENFEPSVDSPRLVPVGNRVLFISTTAQSGTPRLFSTDGTDGGTVQLAGGRDGLYAIELGQPVEAGPGRAVFRQRASTAGVSGLWSTDGTPAGTHRILDRPLDYQTYIFPAAGRAFVAVDSPTTGVRVYVTDGTAAGTQVIHYLEPGAFALHRGLGTMTGGPAERRVLVYGSTPRRIPEVWALDPDVATGSLRGIGYVDFNRNGRREGFELPLSGTAYVDANRNGRVDEDDAGRLAADGFPYFFDGLPVGQYSVRFVPYDTGDSSTIHNPPGGVTSVEIAADRVTDNVDFARNDDRGWIWGRVFEDTDGDGVRGQDEPPLQRQEIYLDGNNNGVFDQGEAVTSTAADGTYGLTFLDGGTYVVRRRYTPRWRQTTPAGGAVAVVTAGPRSVVEAPPVGVQAVVPGALTGAAWSDRNRSNSIDGEDVSLLNQTVFLDFNGDGVQQTEEPTAVSSTPSGQYLFPEVLPGDYVVTLPESASRRQISPASGGRAAAVRSGETTEVAPFLVQLQSGGTVQPGAIEGSIWFDRDGDGTREPEDSPILGRVVWLDTDGDGVLDPGERRDGTDGTGKFAFPDLQPGTYVVRQFLPDATWSQTLPSQLGGGTGPAGRTVTVASQAVGGVDFGSRSAEATPPTATSARYGPASAPFAAAGPAELRIGFSEDLSATLDPSDFLITDSVTGEVVNAQALSVGFDGGSRSAVITFPGLPGRALPAGAYRVVVRGGGVRDAAGNATGADQTLEFAARAVVAGRHAFYNNSVFDGRNPEPNADDDGAIATDKAALLPGGGPMTFSNITSYTRGLNGIMIDLAGLPAGVTPGLNDFAFRVSSPGEAGSPLLWSPAPPIADMTLRRGAGVGGSDRVTFLWPDGAIRNRLLQVVAFATDRTALASQDVFYFGNLVAETGPSSPVAGAFRVDARDMGLARLAHGRAGVHVTDAADFNRDGRVSVTDILMTRVNRGRRLLAFTAAFITMPQNAGSMAPATTIAAVAALSFQEGLPDDSESAALLRGE